MFNKEKPAMTPPAAAAPMRNGPETFLHSGTFFKGEVTFEGILRVEGRFEGTIKGSGMLCAGKDSHIVGEANVGQVQMEGSFQGNISATDRIELAPTAKVNGDIRAPKVSVAEGAELSGKCIIGSARGNGEAHKPAPAVEHAMS